MRKLTGVLVAAVLALTLSACDEGQPGYCQGHPNNSSACG